jgi:hypothetical protein
VRRRQRGGEGAVRDDVVPAPAECGNTGKEIGDGEDRARECRCPGGRRGAGVGEVPRRRRRQRMRGGAREIRLPLPFWIPPARQLLLYCMGNLRPTECDVNSDLNLSVLVQSTFNSILTEDSLKYELCVSVNAIFLFLFGSERL